MTLTTQEADLIQQALMNLVRDKYHMPDTFKDFKSKYAAISSLYEKVESMRPQEPLEF